MNGDKTLPYSTLDTEEFREAAREEAAVLLQSTVDMVGVCPEEGFDSVTDDPRLERAFALIREVDPSELPAWQKCWHCRTGEGGWWRSFNSSDYHI